MHQDLFYDWICSLIVAGGAAYWYCRYAFYGVARCRLAMASGHLYGKVPPILPHDIGLKAHFLCVNHA